MADQVKRDVLLSVDIKNDASAKIAELYKDTGRLKNEQKALDEQVKNGNKTMAQAEQEYVRLGAQIKLNNAETRQYEKALVNALIQEKAQGSTLESMRAQLSNLKLALSQYTKEEIAAGKDNGLNERVANLNAELKELESAYGDNQRKAGEYENAGKALGAQLSELTNKLMEMAAAGLQGSDAYQQLFDEATKLKNAQDEVNQGISNAAKSTAQVDGIATSVNSVVMAYGAWKQASHLIGIENEELDNLMQKLIVAFGALQAVTQLMNLAQKQSNAYRTASNVLQKIGIKQTTAETIATSANAAATAAEATAENASTAAKTKGIIATKLATAQQWLWNAAMSANPVMLLVIAVLALIAGMALLIGWMSKESQAAKDAKAAQEAYNQELQKSEERLKALETQHKNHTRAVQLSTRQTIEALKKRGASEKEIRDAQEKGEKKLRDMEIEFQKQRVRENEALIKLKQNEIQLWTKAQAGVKEGSKRWKEYAASIKEASGELAKLNIELDDANFLIKENAQDQAEADRAADEAAKERAKKAKEAAKAASEARKAALDKELALERAARDAELTTLQDGFNKQSAIIRNNYAKQLEDLAKKLKDEKDLTAKGRAAINDQIAAIEKQQQKELSKLYADFQESLLSSLEKTDDDQIAAVIKKYDKLRAELATMDKPLQLAGQSDEDYKQELKAYNAFMFERASLEYRIEKQKEKEIEAIREGSIAKQMQDIETAVRKEYAGDLAKYATNEREKLSVLTESLEKQKAEKEKAGFATYNEDNQLQQLAAKRNQLDLNVALIRANENAKQIFEAKKAYLEKEREIYKDNADAQLEIAKELRDAEMDLLDARIEKFQEWAGQTATLLSSMNELFAQQGEAELKRYEGEIDAKKKKLDAQLDSGYISQKQYNKRVEKLDAEMAEKQAEIARENAKRERAQKVFTIITDTAMGAAKAVAASPLTFGLPWSAFVLANGGIQLATVLSEPLPKAARGMLVRGRSHTSGGELIEAEGGESIINKRSTSMFAPLLSAINAAGGGVPFTAPLSDGGYTMRVMESQKPISGKSIAAAVRDAIGDLKIYTTIEDYRRADKKYTEIEQSGTF